VGGRLYIISIAREKIRENGYIKRGGVGISERKTAFSGLFGLFLRWHFPFCPWVVVYWAFGVCLFGGMRGGLSMANYLPNKTSKTYM
jgi:hypothetical protein